MLSREEIQNNKEGVLLKVNNKGTTMPSLRYPAGIYLPKVNNRNTRARC